MHEWRIYLRYDCPFCQRALKLLRADAGAAAIQEYDMGGDNTSAKWEALSLLCKQLGQPVPRTVPQIFRVDSDRRLEYIGGCDALVWYFNNRGRKMVQ
jgi:glutaredoxin